MARGRYIWIRSPTITPIRVSCPDGSDTSISKGSDTRVLPLQKSWGDDQHFGFLPIRTLIARPESLGDGLHRDGLEECRGSSSLLASSDASASTLSQRGLREVGWGRGAYRICGDYKIWGSHGARRQNRLCWQAL